MTTPPPISPEDMRSLQEVSAAYRARMAALEAESHYPAKLNRWSLSLSPWNVSRCASALTAASSSRQLA